MKAVWRFSASFTPLLDVTGGDNAAATKTKGKANRRLSASRLNGGSPHTCAITGEYYDTPHRMTQVSILSIH